MKKLLLFLFISLISKIAYNQFSYTMGASAGAYTALSGGGITSAIGNTDDEVISGAINIGFTFNYACTNYTQFKVSSNGWMTFDTGLSSSYMTNDLKNTSSLILAPLWDDLQCTANVKYKLTGAAPNRILTVEWGSMEWNWSSTTAVISFQVKLYEGTNIIDFVYKQEATAVSSGSASIGINGASVGQFYSLNGSGAAPAVSSVTETTTIATKPANGQIYRWTPSPVCAGAPTGGTAVASVNPTTCATPGTVLSLSGSTNSCGITYQWQSSPNNVAWTNIVGATSSTYSTSLSVATYYRCVVTCTNSGSSANSSSVLVNTTATPPANDDCLNATALTVNPALTCTTQTPGTVSCSSASAQANTCSGTADDDVWFKFQATNTSHFINLNNVAGSTFDMFHSVYSGTCAAIGAPLVCSDPDNSSVSGLTVGNWYYVRVYTYTSTPSQTSTFNVCVTTPPPPPANDDCAGALTVTANPSISCVSQTAGTIASATTSAQANTCSGTADDDVWFKFKATSTSHYINLNNITGSTTDLYHSVYSGTCAAIGAPLVCSDPNNSTVTGLTVGNWYYIRVYSYTSTSGQTSSFDVCVTTPPPPPPNDNCAGAIAFPTVPTDGTCSSLNNQYTNSATNSGVTPSGTCTSNSGTPDDDVWYTFVASATTLQLSATYVSGETDMYFQVFTGNCASTNTIYCSDADGGGTLTGLTVGTSYRIRMYTYFGGGVATVQNLCLRTPPPPPPNANCGTPTQFCPSSPVTQVSVTGASAQAGNNYGCLVSQPNPYWYYFTVNTAGNISLDLVGTADMDFILYGPYNNLGAATADCGTYGAPAGEIVDCSFSASYTESIDVVGATIGKVYALLLTNYSNTAQTFTLSFNAGSSGTCGCTPMPIDLLSFDVTKTSEGNMIKWITATERENDYFIIEKMSNNVWESIKLIKGHGNSIVENSYSYIDKNSNYNTEYYRLKQVDFNGNFTYSKIISINKNNYEYQLTNLIPNPTNNSAYIYILSPKSTYVNVEILDNSGRLITSEVYKIDEDLNNEIKINSDKLKSGVYTIVFNINNGEQKTIQKLIKQ